MDKRDFTVIESETKVKEPVKVTRQTNPITRKFVKFHNEKSEKFSVKDLFKGVRS